MVTAQRYLCRSLLKKVDEIFQSCPDVVGSNGIFPLDLLERHSAGKASYDYGDGESSTADYRPAPEDGGIKDEAIL